MPEGGPACKPARPLGRDELAEALDRPPASARDGIEAATGERTRAEVFRRIDHLVIPPG